MRYPNGINKINHNISYSKRGMTLESDINESNKYYLNNDIAVIYKKPTPITIVKVDYPSRDKAMIKEAYFSVPSTTDYNGLYKGKYIDFEAKETKNKTLFSLNNIHTHQIKHLDMVDKHGGIAFIIIRFTSLNETYLIMARDFIEYSINKKSIPISFFREKGFLIKIGFNPMVDYLNIIDKLLEGDLHE